MKFFVGLLYLIFVVLAGCGGGGGGGSAPIPPALPVSITLTASNSAVYQGGSISLNWTSTNASTCSASGAWAGEIPTAGSQTVSVTTLGRNKFVISCLNAAKTESASTTQDVYSAPKQGTVPSTSGVNNGFPNGAATYTVTFSDGTINTLTWNADTEYVTSKLPDGTTLNYTIASNGYTNTVLPDGVTTNIEYVFPDVYMYNSNRLTTTDFSKAPVFKVPVDISKVIYPDSYATPGSSTEYKLSDACDLDMPNIIYPQSYIWGGNLPSISGGPIPKTMIRTVSVKDIWSPDNPTSTGGCSKIGGARSEFLELLTRLKYLNVDFIEPTPWTNAVVQADGTWKILPVASDNVSMSDDDFAWVTSQAHKVGFKVHWPNQIGTFTDSKGNSLAAPDATVKNFSLLMSAYSEYMLGRAKFLQSIGADSMMISCHCLFQTNRPDLLDIYQQTLESLIPKIKAVYSGKLRMDNSPVIKRSSIINGNIDIIQIVLNPVNGANLRPSVQEVIANLSGSLSSQLPDIDPSRNYLLSVGAPSNSSGQSVEETMCLPDPLGRSRTSCWQRDIPADYVTQANIYEGFFEFLTKQNSVRISEVYINNYFLTNNIIPTTTFINLGASPRNKPAEGILKAWFAK